MIMPLETSRRQQKLRSKPWLTKGIHISIRNRRTMFRALFLLGNISEKIFYRKNSNKLNKIIALSKKKNHFSFTLDKAKNDSKKTWDLIRSMLPTKTDGAASIIDHFEAECDSIEPISVTNCFNNCFLFNWQVNALRFRRPQFLQLFIKLCFNLTELKHPKR